MVIPSAEEVHRYQSSEIEGKYTPAKFHIFDEIIELAKRLSAETKQAMESGFDVFVDKAIYLGS